MHSGLNLLLAVGILANLVKGGDLILRASQKKMLQDRFETLTLWIDDLRPVQWLSYLPRPKPALWWSVISTIYALLIPVRQAGGAIAILVDITRDSIATLLIAQHVDETR